jgi:hypothetical protein
LAEQKKQYRHMKLSLGTIVFFFLSGQAWARCFTPMTFLPSSGSSNVPRNLVIRGIGPISKDSVVVFVPTEDGGVGPSVPCEITNAQSSLEIRPLMPLAANTTYSVSGQELFGFGGKPRSTFKTGDFLDTTPPSAVAINGSTFKGTDAFTPTLGQSVTFALSQASDDSTPLSDLWVEAFANENNAGFGILPAAGFRLNTPTLNSAKCDANYALDKASDLEVKLRVVDWSGNVSGASAPRRVKNCGCASGETALVALALLLISVRRSTKRKS